MSAQSIPPALIEKERRAGWPTIHPEDFCHRCGAKNMLWFADAPDWNVATRCWAAETGREGICCPLCFAEMYQEATGLTPVWAVRPHFPSEETL